MDKLINIGKDVELLRDDEAVTQIFNKLGYFVHYDTEAFYYEDITGRVNRHCKRDWNIWKAKLKKDYFNSPWSPISETTEAKTIVAFFWCFGLLIRGYSFHKMINLVQAENCPKAAEIYYELGEFQIN
ncbi:UPF0481 protein isoform X3 [Gossypium australe]|uniref:UPF0481 protein isoform X3 n=1 Tax=Gossypium australe TaxID=47621 RepID=A0A5B6WZ69_9ROSI|nr:UPF0481 protein isoform X3 [Gossypium australe]